MNSIAILYSPKDSEKPNITLNAEVHINLWKLPKENPWAKKCSYERFIDFGVMIESCPENVETLLFYLPFKIKEGEISDLIKTVNNDSELLCTLFNSDLSIQSVWNNRSYHYVSSPTNDRKDFWMYELGEDNFKLSSCDGGNGTLLHINIMTNIPSLPKSPIKIENEVTKTQLEVQPNIEDISSEKIKTKDEKGNPSLYIRFRIKCDGLENYNYTEKVSNDFLQSAFSKVEILDFRINDKREINKKVIEKLNKGSYFFSFTKIHFFFVTSSKEEPLPTGKDTPDCRILEIEKWEKYLSGIGNNKKRKMLAYHWSKKQEKEGKPFDNYNLFLKIMHSSINWKTILLYSSVIIVLGALGSWLASFFSNLNNIIKYIEEIWIK